MEEKRLEFRVVYAFEDASPGHLYTTIDLRLPVLVPAFHNRVRGFAFRFEARE